MENAVVVGLAGKAGVGKTVTGDYLAPPIRTEGIADGDGFTQSVWWDHLWFSMPLKEIVTVKQTIEGVQAFDRLAYPIHQLLVDILGGPAAGAPPYDELVKLVHEIVEARLPRDGKPRAFLQWLGTDVCRQYSPDCFVRWMAAKVADVYRDWKIEHQNTNNFGVVLSDVRFANETKWINNRGITVLLTCDERVRKERLLERDGTLMSEEEMSHASETGLDELKFSYTLDTTDMSVREQAAAVTYYAKEYLDAHN